jgi:hypothetical protein
MAYDPTKPVDDSPLDAAEMRGQLTALKALIDAQQAQITAMQLDISNRALMPQMGEFDPSIDDPPTTANLQEFRVYIRGMAEQLMGVQW